MPIVVSPLAQKCSYVAECERLAEILGHSDFDGEPWAVGDTIIFEDQTTALIERHEDGFHLWSDCKPVDLEDAHSLVQSNSPASNASQASIESWEQLFEAVRTQPAPKRQGWLRIAAASIALVVLFILTWLVWALQTRP